MAHLVEAVGCKVSLHFISWGVEQNIHKTRLEVGFVCMPIPSASAAAAAASAAAEMMIYCTALSSALQIGQPYHQPT